MFFFIFKICLVCLISLKFIFLDFLGIIMCDGNCNIFIYMFMNVYEILYMKFIECEN